MREVVRLPARAVLKDTGPGHVTVLRVRPVAGARGSDGYGALARDGAEGAGRLLARAVLMDTGP